MSQENVIKFWVALHPLFPDSYSVGRIPEQGCITSPFDRLTFALIVTANFFDILQQHREDLAETQLEPGLFDFSEKRDDHGRQVSLQRLLRSVPELR